MGEASVRVDRDECIVCGACWEDCPIVFEESPDDGLTQVVEKYRVGTDLGQGKVPEDLEECIRNAADGCPVEIIHRET